MTTRKPTDECPHCRQSAHPGMWACRLGAAVLNRGVAALMFVLRVPGELPEAHGATIQH